jgi:hypothetical protein
MMGTDVVLVVVVVVVVAVVVAVVVVSQWRRENVIVLGTAGVRGFERRLFGDRADSEKRTMEEVGATVAVPESHAQIRT